MTGGDFGLDRAIVHAVASTTLPTDPSSEKTLKMVKTAYVDKKNRLLELRETFEAKLQAEEDEAAKLQAIFDLEKIAMTERYNRSDLERIRKNVMMRQGDRLLLAHSTLRRSLQINHQWKELTDNRADCLSQETSYSKQYDIPEINVAIASILGDLQKIEEEKSQFLNKAETQTAKLLEKLDRLLLCSDFERENLGQQKAAEIIARIARVFDVPLGERTLFIEEADLEATQDETWYPTTENDIRIAGIFSGTRKDPPITRGQKRSHKDSPDSEKSPILNPIKRYLPQDRRLSPCSSPIHFCWGSQTEGLPKALPPHTGALNESFGSNSRCFFDDSISDAEFELLCGKLPRP